MPGFVRSRRAPISWLFCVLLLPGAGLCFFLCLFFGYVMLAVQFSSTTISWPVCVCVCVCVCVYRSEEEDTCMSYKEEDTCVIDV
jgi:hypothetical protein